MQGMVEGGVHERNASGSAPSTAFGGPPPRAGEDLRGTLTANGSLADFIWFRTGGPAEWLVRPSDVDDLAGLLKTLDPSTPVLPPLV